MSSAAAAEPGELCFIVVLPFPTRRSGFIPTAGAAP